MRILSALFYGFSAFGVGITALHVVPMLWNTNVFDCIIVASSLFLAVVLQVTKAITGRWSLE